MEERPWRRAFWIGDADARVLGAFRACFGALLLFDLVDRLQDFRLFYTDEGLLPRGELFNSFLRHWRFSLFDTVGDPLLVGALYLAGFLCVLAFALGWRTRLTSVLSWLFVMSLQERNLVVLDGGDGVIRCLSFWLVFADCGAAYSLDVRLGRRAEGERVPILPLRVMQLQVGLVYWMAAVNKFGSQWHDGTAVYHALQLSDWSRPAGVWLLGHPQICDFITRSTVWIEYGFPLTPLVPLQVVRALGLVIILGMHAGIFLTMRVGLFSIIMPVTMILFVRSEWIDWAERRSGWARPRVPPLPARHSRLWQAVMALEMVCVLWTQTGSRLWVLPQVRRAAASEVELLGLWQSWAMFSPNPLGEDGHWEGPGTLQNGLTVDVLGAVAPRLLGERSFFFTRWIKYRSELYADTYGGAMRMLANWICREFNHRSVPELQLAEFDLVYWQTPTHAPGEPHGEAHRLQRWHERCDVTPMRPASPLVRPPIRH